MTRNHHFQSPREETMQALTEFETRITRSSPQPRDTFQQELSHQLLKEFEQRGRAKQVLTSIPSRRFGKLSARTAVILVAILTIGIGAVIAMNAAFQQFINYDAGLKAIYEQGLGHEIGISQTIDDFTVTLEWAYADDNRLTLAYVIAGVPDTPYTNLTNDLYRLRLRDTGQEIPFYQSMNTLIDQQGEAVGWGAPADVIPTSDRSLTIATFDLNALERGDNPILDLQLEVDAYGITLQQRTRMPIEEFNAMKEGPEGHFTFDFSVALVDEIRVMDTPLSATDRDITLILRRVTVSPSQTRVIVCFSPPDPTRQWTAIPLLKSDDGDVPGGGGVQPFMDGELTCNDYTYFAGMVDYTGEWQLEVTELVGFGSGGGNDQQRIPGLWLFEFVVP
jgi:hypothetical protein